MPQEQEQKRVQKQGAEDAAPTPSRERRDHRPRAEELKDEMDEILDEIDSVLEQNAEEFVKSYVQKGGE